MATFLENELDLSQLDLDNELQKKVASKQLSKGSKAKGAASAYSAGTDVKSTGALQAGGEAALSAGLATSFNPYVMAGAAAIGMLTAAEKRKQQRREQKAKAQEALAEGKETTAAQFKSLATSIQSILS